LQYQTTHPRGFYEIVIDGGFITVTSYIEGRLGFVREERLEPIPV
jgi:hypothetical protein